jgi:tetrahydromethanopterin S-methyltransferase subunit G
MAENSVPEIIVDPSDYRRLIEKLDLIDEKIEFTHSEMQQKIGKRIGRDIGVLYGICIGLIVVVVYLLLVTTLGLKPTIPFSLEEGESFFDAIIRIILR